MTHTLMILPPRCHESEVQLVLNALPCRESTRRARLPVVLDAGSNEGCLTNRPWFVDPRGPQILIQGLRNLQPSSAGDHERTTGQ